MLEAKVPLHDGLQPGVEREEGGAAAAVQRLLLHPVVQSQGGCEVRGD